MNDIVTLLTYGKPVRDITITADEIINLVILLNTTNDVNDFLEAIA
jgi:hypothetical protein